MTFNRLNVALPKLTMLTLLSVLLGKGILTLTMVEVSPWEALLGEASHTTMSLTKQVVLPLSNLPHRLPQIAQEKPKLKQME